MVPHLHVLIDTKRTEPFRIALAEAYFPAINFANLMVAGECVWASHARFFMDTTTRAQEGI